MKVGFLKDPFPRENFDEHKASLLLFSEALKNKAETYLFSPDSLSVVGFDIFAKAKKITHVDFNKKEIDFEKERLLDLSELDVIMLRLDPPFDMRYITVLTILERIKSKVYIANNPTSIKNFFEKMPPFDLGKFAPPTLITSNIIEVRNFRKEYGDIVLKPLNAYAGEGIMLIKKDDVNLDSAFELLYRSYKLPVIAQKFLPDIKKGDKRIFIVDGNVEGYCYKVPQDGKIIGNLRAGGHIERAEFTKRDQEICDIIIPELKKRDILVCGLDVIGGFVTEINVTNPAWPTDLILDAPAKIWQAIEKYSD